jgi:hypothetical protein
MFTGHKLCPRCGNACWHADQKDTLPTGVVETLLTCINCAESLLVRSVKPHDGTCVVCRRWTLMHMGQLKPVYREWVKQEPAGIVEYDIREAKKQQSHKPGYALGEHGGCEEM